MHPTILAFGTPILMMSQQPTIGFIGAGNMATAIIQGMISGGHFAPSQIAVSNRTAGKLAPLAEGGCVTTTDNRQVASISGVLFIAVKPHLYKTVLDEIKDHLHPDTVVVSMAAGLTTQWLATHLHPDTSIVRIMPNTPAAVRTGMTAIAPNDSVTKAQLQQVIDIMDTVGHTSFVEERLLDAFTGVAGSSPAYIYVLIDALADAGVLHGLTKDDAIHFAAQAVKGAAEMVLSTTDHPVKLKDNVCSPGGATVAAIASLEQNGLRHGIIQAASAAIVRSQEIGKQMGV